MLNIGLFQFSGTGNTYFISRKIQNALIDMGCRCDVLAIETIIDPNPLILEYDIIGLGYPIYGSDVPDVVRWFIDRLDMHPHKRAFVFCTQLMYSGDGAAYGARLLARKGFVTHQMEHFNMPNNITDFKIFRERKPLSYDKINHKHDKRIKRFVEKIVSNRCYRKGNNPFSLMLGLLQRIPYQTMEKSKWKKIKIEDTCIQCNTCVELCPVQNLKIVDHQLKAFDQCILCYRCINHCPVRALHISNNSTVKAPYRGPTQQFSIGDVKNHYLYSDIDDKESSKGEKK